MKLRLSVLFCALLLLVSFSDPAGGEITRTIRWTNPSSYTDGSPIPAELRSTIETRIYYTLDETNWSLLAAAHGGAESWAGPLPVPEGVPACYAATSTIPSVGVESGRSQKACYPGPIPRGMAFGEIPADFRASLLPVADTFVGVGGESNHSSDPWIGTYTWPSNQVANRGFLQWDLTTIPGDASVHSATLWLFYGSEEGGGRDEEYTVGVSKVVGVRPDLDRATWNTYDNVSPWTGGSDGGAGNLAAAESTATIGKRHRWVSWDVTEMVQEWITFPGTNNGMAVDADTNATLDSHRFFASMEHPEPSIRPRLEVGFRRSSANGIPPAEQAPSPAEAGGAGVPYLSGPSAHGYSVAMEAVEDTWVNLGGDSNTSFASHPEIRTYTWPSGSVANRGFLSWNLSLLPPEAMVTGATLWLYSKADRARGSGLYWVGISSVTGVVPDTSRLTWNTFDGTTPWSGGADGGFSDLSPPETVSAVGMEGGWTMWNVTSMVREAVISAGTLFVTAVEGDPYARVDSRRYFFSRDHSDRAVHPRLVVTYTLAPAPAAPEDPALTGN